MLGEVTRNARQIGLERWAHGCLLQKYTRSAKIWTVGSLKGIIVVGTEVDRRLRLLLAGYRLTHSLLGVHCILEPWCCVRENMTASNETLQITMPAANQLNLTGRVLLAALAMTLSAVNVSTILLQKAFINTGTAYQVPDSDHGVAKIKECWGACPLRFGGN